MALNKTYQSTKHPAYTYIMTSTQSQIREGEYLRAELIFPVVFDYAKQREMVEAIIKVMANAHEEAVFDFGDSE